MAWNPSPHIAECREIADRRHVDQVLLFTIDRDGKTEMDTYGRTRTLCDCARILGDVAATAIERHIAALVRRHERTHPPKGPDLFTPTETAHIPQP
jgi:hypothetical protein